MTRVADFWLRLVGWLALAGGLMGAAGCGSSPATAPTSYAQYNANDGTFACDYPDGWEADGGGKRGLGWAKFKSGTAEISISTGVAGSLMGDIAGSFGGSDAEAQAPEEAPVAKVHEAGTEAAAQTYNGYEEVGPPAELDVRLGPARNSEFTSSTSFGTGMRGYRATVLGHDKCVTVFCVCPDSDWTTLQPAFDHVLSTLKRGQAE